MAGHSHSANIKYRKDRVNAAKAKAFAKVARMITVAARLGGGDPEANARLRLAMEKARMVSMPKENVERAIRKGAGGGDLGDYEEVLYEGYAPFGVAVMLEILTDNRHRTAADVRLIFERNGGNLGNAGAVTWMFERKATVRIERTSEVTEERLLEVALEVGADDLIDLGGAFELCCEPAASESLRAAIVAAGITVAGGEIGWIPNTTARIESIDDARRVLRCIDALEDNDDVQSVASNFEFSDAVIATLFPES